MSVYPFFLDKKMKILNKVDNIFLKKKKFLSQNNEKMLQFLHMRFVYEIRTQFYCIFF